MSATEARQIAGMGEASHRLHAAAVRLIKGGKRVGDAAYLHASLLSEQASAVQQLVSEALGLIGSAAAPDFDVVRVGLKRPEVALLSYPGFFEDPFPVLRTSWLVDLAAARVAATDFSGRENPPILHRKELLLPEAHPDRGRFEQLTAALDDYGAFDRPAHLIGHRLYWADTLAALGLRVEGHEVVRDEGGAARASEGRLAVPNAVARHRTAISRNRLSTPMQALARWGFFDGALTVLDYGCGRGDDVRALAVAGVAASGWDPHFAPDAPLEAADVVNLGFVLNVIENTAERAEALRRAYGLARRVLAVAVMLTGQGGGPGHADGVFTSRGTFQRYFSQVELREYVAGVLGREPVTVGPGIAFVFRSDQDEQEFLARRQRSAPSPVDRFEIPSLGPRGAQTRPTACGRHQELLDAFWAAALELGRLPEVGEFDQAAELSAAVGSARRAFAALPFADKEGELARAATRRTEDLLVYLALNLFERRVSLRSMPPAVQRDVKGFFGSHKAALDQARAALFEAGDGGRTAAASAAAADRGIGVLDPRDGDYTFHASTLDHQPALLRIVLGCAERLEPQPADLDLVKVHGSGRRVSYLRFDGFEERALPVLARRTVVDLRRQLVTEPPVETPDGRRVLLGKARFMVPGMRGRERQERFDDDLRQRGVLECEGLGPGLRELARRLARAGIGVGREQAKPALAARPSSRP